MNKISKIYGYHHKYTPIQYHPLMKEEFSHLFGQQKTFHLMLQRRKVR